MADIGDIEDVSASANGSAQLNFVDLDAALQRAIRGGPSVVDAHLRLLERDIVVGKTLTNLHCYFLPLDGNGRVRFKPLAEFLRDRIVDYAIPRRAIEEAQRQAHATGSTAPLAKLDRQAESLFTDLAKSGEGGELLLFAMAESVFGLAQILCKMSLKTSTSMHYHGADGVYANVRTDGGLNIYWGESKIYDDATTAIRDCLASLSPFLVQPEGQDAARSQDILLINEFANFTDQKLVEALRRVLDPDNASSLKTKNCGIALVAFDCSSYPADGAASTMDALEAAIKEQLPKWMGNLANRITQEKLDKFDVHFICVPIPSAAAFRKYFLQLLGVTE